MNNQVLDTNYTKEVAQTIYAQLNVIKTELWAWGAKDYVYLNRKVENMSCPALMFSIRTPKIQRGGRVIISYNEGTDTYIVEAIRVTKGEEKLIGINKEVYCDELHNAINLLIEDEETYTKILF